MTATSLSKKTAKSKAVKPGKPRPDFPLTPHDSGKWCKKVRGTIHYFGSWDDPVGALQEWLAAKDYLLAGVEPPRGDDQKDIGWLVNMFLDSKEQQRRDGELAAETFANYLSVCQRLTDFFKKKRLLTTIGIDDFKRFRQSFPKTWGPVTINNAIARTSAVFNFAKEYQLLDRPIEFGPNFKRVSRKKQRLERAKRPKKQFSAEEIHRLIEHADFQMKAMILLGINCGYGPADCGRLETSMIDFDRQWIEGLREKTAVERAVWLWPETVKALREAIDNRYPNAPKSLEKRVFITKRRQSWHREGKVEFDEKGKPKVRGLASPMSAEFAKLAFKADCRRDGVGFYALRHVFETVGGNAKDQVAVNYVMGHDDESMAAVYREGIDPQRIIAVCRYVRKWWLKGKPENRTSVKGGAK